MKTLKLIPLMIALTACGGDYKDADKSAPGQDVSFGNQKARVVNGTLDVSGGSIKGTGSIVFDSRFEEFKSGGSYAVDFNLEDGGSVTIVSHANESLASGFEVQYLRQGSGPGSLKVSLRAQGAVWNAVNQFAAIDAAQAIRIQTDVHNDESPAHSITWNRNLGDDFAKEKAILNTAEEVDGSPGIGTGVRWGLILTKATVTRADRSEPKFED